MALIIVGMVLLSCWFPVLAWSVVGFVYMGLTAMPFLMMLFGLTCDGGTSVLSRALRQPLAKWLGAISYSLYLSHTLVIGVIEYFILTGVGPVPTCTDDSDECKQLWFHLYRRREWSGWYAFPMLAAALVLAWLTFTFVEEPTRKYLCRSLDESGSTKPSGTWPTWRSFGSLADRLPLADETASTSTPEEAGRAALLPDGADSRSSGAVKSDDRY
jgi:peptidoglycan/LPS O-acetylase OafA/YrhL